MSSLASRIKQLASGSAGGQASPSVAQSAAVAYSVPAVRLPPFEVSPEAAEAARALAKALNLNELPVVQLCTSSEGAKQWCLYLYALVTGQTVNPPGFPPPPGLEALIEAVYRATGFPDLRRYVEARQRLAEEVARIVREIRERAREAAMRLTEGKVKDSVSRVEEILQTMALIERRIPRQVLAEHIASSMVSVLAERAYVPPEQAVRAKTEVIKQLLAFSPDNAQQSAQSVVEALRRAFVPQTGQISAQQAVRAQQIAAGRTAVQPAGEQISTQGLPTILKKMAPQ